MPVGGGEAGCVIEHSGLMIIGVIIGEGGCGGGCGSCGGGGGGDSMAVQGVAHDCVNRGGTSSMRDGPVINATIFTKILLFYANKLHKF